jgi:methionyl-tRNA synthetase
MATSTRTILVTSALPYANGPIHIGHLVEYIQTDIWVRFQKLRGHRCFYVCADDAHGTPIMLRAEQEGIAPGVLIARVGEEHRADFRDFAIEFDNYHTTHSEENRELSNFIYTRLREAGHIVTRQVRQAYDPERGMFLPDRYVRGTCPRCGARDQYGDSCEVCGATYSPAELVDPVSVLSGARPVERESEHYFVRLADFADMLQHWVRGGDTGASPVQIEIANKLDEWFDAGLHDWDISRDAPYFGFEIPDAPGKYFYVWMDAPIGYMASFKNLCARRPDLEFDAFWRRENEAELYHFIGKDIAYFHTLFWPAQLDGAGFRTPTGVFCHGFLTVDGQKMSKSRGTFIQARTYLEHLNPEYLRYYFAAKLGNGIDDLDLNFDDFLHRVNADLVGKVVNIASRCAGFIIKGFGGQLSSRLAEPELHARFVSQGDGIAGLFERREFGRAVREIMALADVANQYIDERKPWILARDPQRSTEVQDVCTMGLNLFRILMIYLKPVLPVTARRAEEFLGVKALRWADLNGPLLDHCINAFRALLTRVERTDIDAVIAASRDDLSSRGGGAGQGHARPQAQPEPLSEEPLLAEQIGIDEFSRVDLRVARIETAEQVPGADKLLKLVVDIGGEKRTVYAGIKGAYTPEELTGRLTVVVANLAPRRMRFGTSEGMVLAAGPGGADIWLLGVDSGASPGMRVK